jgi:hypothetical protein
MVGSFIFLAGSSVLVVGDLFSADLGFRQKKFSEASLHGVVPLDNRHYQKWANDWR